MCSMVFDYKRKFKVKSENLRGTKVEIRAKMCEHG